MQSRSRNSSPKALKTTRDPIVAAPKGGVSLGSINGRHVTLSPRQRSFHVLLIGASGCGKTVSLENLARQDIDNGSGTCVIDPMGSAYERLLDYCCYRKATGCRVPEIILFNPSEGGEWILPFNPFVRRDGEISVQVDRRVSATLRVWGQHSGDETPRLEKWLKCLYTALIASNLTILEAGTLLDQHAGAVREFVLRGLHDGLVRNKLEQLGRYKPSEFLEQTESVENRLLRFLSSSHLCRIFGTGRTALDFRSIMDESKIVLVNLKSSDYLSPEQRRLFGTFLINEFYETALTRPSGAKPFYLYLDEAGQYLSSEIGEALEQTIQKGLHFTLAVQHLAQIKEQGERVYKAVKINVRNKVIFSTPDRQDALELADDVFVGLAEPQLKFMHRRLNHEITDTRLQSTTTSRGENSSTGTSSSSSVTHGRSGGSSESESRGTSHALQQGFSKTSTFSRGTAETTSEGESNTATHSESHGRSYAEQRSRSLSSSVNSSETAQQTHDSFLFASSTEPTSVTDGRSDSSTEGYSRSESGHDDYSDGGSHTDTSNHSTSSNTSLSYGRTRQRSTTDGTSQTNSTSVSRSASRTHGRNQGETSSHGYNTSVSKTDQPGVLHRAFLEEDPEHWTLEEQRWRSSELLMDQQMGHWFVRTTTEAGFGSTPLPRPVYTLANQRLRLRREFYQRHSITPDEANQELERRLEQLRTDAENIREADSEPAGSATNAASPLLSAATGQVPAEPIWGRPPANPAPATLGRRGPKPDTTNHTKVAAIVGGFGINWTEDDNLLEICGQLDAQAVPIPKTWPDRRDGTSRSWRRGFENYRHLVIKAIKDRVKAAQAGSQVSPSSNSRQLPLKL